ncbi:glycosyltransferase family 4 protein [Paenibacillus sp. KQZ6P-2]|uniref:Glycosyltransferase family 4 protein n=1 Tax=Paenibacillus mangrovi TaxID=2931978 RepID=A0A9X2B2B7_9BACL|nr:glycosyltransferase family 4 protein [Paenibacillus mangrovi]MCJ8012344.1 glycosyltransferase family 4 protein [Paenibacillus mangrovi]
MKEETKQLKVWVMSYEFEPKIIGGLGIVATHLTRTLSKAGMKVTVLCSGNSNRLTISNPNRNLRILRFPNNSQYFNRTQNSFNADAIIRVASRMGYTKPDLIHVHSTEFANTAKKARDQFGIPIVYSCHSIASQSLSSPSGKNQTKLVRIAKRIIVPSHWLADAIRKHYPDAASNKITVIPHGVKPVSKKSNGAPTKLLYAGRLIPSKGIESLLKAIALLSNEHKSVHLTIVGSGTKSYQQKLRSLARQVGITKRIRWVKSSPYKTIQEMYASYGAVIVPSKTESFCLVALEAMANGVPLVATRSGGLKEFVNKGNAQIIHAVNSVSIARAIKEFWDHPSQSKRRMINARTTATQYKWPAISGKYKSLFTSLMKEKIK